MVRQLYPVPVYTSTADNDMEFSHALGWRNGRGRRWKYGARTILRLSWVEQSMDHGNLAVPVPVRRYIQPL
ncbi:MAG: hypothetical protein OXD43_05825 [Bacteroidetes bacterium]|nr:hypothetical protein [Bacteroidota bacterium]